MMHKDFRGFLAKLEETAPAAEGAIETSHNIQQSKNDRI